MLERTRHFNRIKLKIIYWIRLYIIVIAGPSLIIATLNLMRSTQKWNVTCILAVGACNRGQRH